MLARRLLLLGVLAVLGRAPHALAAEVYDYAIDHFAVDGNVHGALDGIPDVDEDFADGLMGPTFHGYLGGVSEAGGALHLQSPGWLAGFVGVTPVRFETSVALGDGAALQVGGGDAVLRVTLPGAVVGPNDMVHVFLSWYDADALYYGGLAFANLNRSLGDAFSPPVPPGPSVFSHLEAFGYPESRIESIEARSLDPLAMTGPVVLELRWNDAARTLVPRYSLDGGTTFQPALAPLPVDTSSPTLAVYLAVAAYQGECPAGIHVRSARFRKLGVPGRSAATIRLFMPQPLGYRPMRIVLTDEGAGGATLLDAQLPSPGTPPCDPRDGWTAGAGRNSRYNNVGNALPPGCAAGSAGGLQRYQTRWTGTADVLLKIKDASLPPIVGPLRVAVYDGTGPANACDGFRGDAACVASRGAVACSTGP